MSSFNEFCNDAKRIARKAAKKTGELAHSASLRIKLEGVKNKLSSNYEKLGRLTYKQLKTSETQADKISAVIPEIDRLRDEVSAMRREIEEDKKRREESKKQAAAAKVNIEVIIPEAREETKADAENNAD